MVKLFTFVATILSRRSNLRRLHFPQSPSESILVTKLLSNMKTCANGTALGRRNALITNGHTQAHKTVRIIMHM